MFSFLRKLQKNKEQEQEKEKHVQQEAPDSFDSRAMFFRKYAHLPEETKTKLNNALDEWENEA